MRVAGTGLDHTGGLGIIAKPLASPLSQGGAKARECLNRRVGTGSDFILKVSLA